MSPFAIPECDVIAILRVPFASINRAVAIGVYVLGNALDGPDRSVKAKEIHTEG